MILDDPTDNLFSVESSGVTAGQVRLSGILDRETDVTHTVNIRVILIKYCGIPILIYCVHISGFSCC